MQTITETTTTRNGQTVAVGHPDTITEGATVTLEDGTERTILTVGKTFTKNGTPTRYGYFDTPARSSRPRRRRSGTTRYGTNSGWTGTRNSAGRCIDAPCCGCCTF